MFEKCYGIFWGVTVNVLENFPKHSWSSSEMICWIVSQTQFSGKSSCEIPFAIMFVFQKIHVMHSHLIYRLPGAYEMHYAISIIFIQIYHLSYILKFTFTPHVIQQYGSTNTQIISLEQIIISSPMAYTHNYIPYN